ncbi:MAG: FAD-dependent 5-carboxymethylaminomethyl-2-thiouridine(34) oxidoreductase MnmC [Rubrivivax sp.]|nr:FAD-dependent 5-carboxymethylaminomethyl-2-thiouridine(34) oxidoreductase MnmC [Rubrivivax sp.]MBK7262338.1 FAD-dependent 5-carboxymethylaminomethyl-2-thiouridine(34) oxidoreductase MnmC [Rubrivivax sp.]MBK8528560.1 FAD-dependent 5-carboxymethylaminomethyl-2-thiouridine(34) oxidoreductase MnmC [Rubrivivax sp.]
MRTEPIVPARIAWADDGSAHSIDFGDPYQGHAGPAAQARHVFLAGNSLPARWAGRSDFSIAETGFGLGHNFIATWKAWRDDPQRPTRLHYVAVDAHPPALSDLKRAHGDAATGDLAAQLFAAWPPLVPGLHRFDFDGGGVQLLLALGDVRRLLPELVFSADAFYLDGFSPARNAAMWEPRVIKALARRARPGATAATWSVAGNLRRALTTAGFEWQREPGIAGKREVLRARFAPHWAQPKAAAQVDDSSPRRAVVVGAGLAGACTAAALARQGFEVQMLDAQAEPAQGSSGNPAGLFHATVHGEDGIHARLFRAAALHAARCIAASDGARVPHAVQGLLRLEQQLDLAAMRALIERQCLPADFVQALSAADASLRAGLTLPSPAWFYAQGGWVAPAALVRQQLGQPGVRFVGQARVAELRRDDGGWACLDAQGHVIASAPQLVLACADQVNTLLQGAGWPAFPLQRQRGQVSQFSEALALRMPVSGDGYALPLPDGGLLCGATRGGDDEDPQPRDEDHRANFTRLQRLCGLQAPADPARWSGRVGWRVGPPDRLPLAGPMFARQRQAGQRLDQARLLPREPGLHLACGFGARGITLAPLLGEAVAAVIAGTPVPLEQSLIDSVDPGRWLVRDARRGATR